MRVAYRIKQFILLAGDIAAFFIGLLAALAMRFFAIPDEVTVMRHLPLFAATFFLWVLLNYITALYDLRQLIHKTFFRRFFQTAAVALLASMIFFYLLPDTAITPKTILFLNVAIGYGLSALWRLLYRRLLRTASVTTPVVLVGFPAEAADLIDVMAAHPEKGFTVAAVIDPDHHIAPHMIPSRVDVYRGLHTIRPAVSTHSAGLVVIAPHLQDDTAALRELYELLFWNVQIENFPSFYERMTGRIPPSTFSEGWFLDHLKNKEAPAYQKLRTLLDYLAAAALGVVFLAVLPLVTAGVKLSSRGPVFIRQKRVGQGGKPFMLYKFRSMYALSSDGSAETTGAQFAQKKDARITPFGKFLRKTRLDELPQVINLFRRDITLIGPRPERPEIVAQLTERMPYYPLRHIIKPGLTGWAVLHQNYTDSMETTLQKLQYDLYYIKNRSAVLDLFIVLKTLHLIGRMVGQ